MPFGRFKWLRLAFGLSAAPKLFQIRMHNVLASLPDIACICDDVLEYGSGYIVEEARIDHDQNISALFDRYRQKRIRLSLEKLLFDQSSTVFIGHELTLEGLLLDGHKVTAIHNMPATTDRAGVLRLLGTVTFLAKFCPNFCKITAPIRQLLLYDTEFR